MTNALDARSSNAIISVVIGATISTVLPGFLVGALSVQVSDDFGVTESRYGWGLGSFFLAATFGSAFLGKSAQQFGPRRQVVGALLVSAVASLSIAAFANSFLVFVIALSVAGFANSGNQTAINLLLSQAQLPRLGLAIALKQSGMPAAALLGGLSVPVIAVTIGWRWAYVLSACAALGALAAILVTIAPVGRMAAGVPRAPITSHRTLVQASVGFGFMAFAAGALNAWLVGSAVDSGVGDGRAGLLLSFGAGLGIVVRLLIGTRLDTMRQPTFLAAAVMSAIGAIGIALLAIGSSTILIPATAIAFGGGWVWPVFTNFGVVRANREAAASATGVTQTGVYVGVFAGPLVSGILIDQAGYATMWLATASVMVLGAVITATTAPAFHDADRRIS